MKKRFLRNVSIIFIFMFVATIFLVIVQILFKMPAPYGWLEAEWSAGDFITFFGTIVLGAVACMQTREANKMSQKLMQIEENRDRLEISPFVIVTKWEMYDLNKSDLYHNDGKIRIGIDNSSGNDDQGMLGFSLQFQNTTRSFVTVEFRNGQSTENTKWAMGGMLQSKSNRKLLLKDGESGEIIFYASKKFIMDLEGEKCELKFILENRFAQRYEEKFNVIITHIGNNDTGICCNCFVQDYEITKCGVKEKQEIKKN